MGVKWAALYNNVIVLEYETLYEDRKARGEYWYVVTRVPSSIPTKAHTLCIIEHG